MRTRRAIALSSIVALSSAWAAEASAKECANPLINTCINSDTLWPNPGPVRFATVAGTETVGKGQVGFGLVATYLSRPILVRVATPGPGGSDAYVVDDQVNGNFLFAYGVTKRLQLDFALPVTFVETGAGVSPLTGGKRLSDTAIRDLRFGFAYAIVPRERVEPTQASGFALTSRLTVSAPSGDSSDFAGERAAVFVPSLAADYRIDRLFFGAELGARLRPPAEFAGARVGTQLVTALGVGYDVLPRELLSVMLEGRAYPTFTEQHDTQQSAFGITSSPNGNHITPAEWMLSARTAPILGGDVAVIAGGGGPIPFGEAITVPRFRFVLGAVYAPTERDTDADGIPDKNDACPDQKGVRGGERPGCPTSPEPPPAVPPAPTPEPPPTTPQQP